MRLFWIGVVVVAAGSGCGAFSKDERTVAGRTRSAAAAAANGAAPIAGTLRAVRVTDQATGTVRAEVHAVLTDGAGAVAGAVRLPDGDEVALVASGAVTFVVDQEVMPAELVRFGAGRYTFVSDRADGTHPTTTVSLEGTSPPAPQVVEPPDMASGVGPAPTIAWTWEGTAALFDVRVTDALTGNVAWEAHDVAGRSVEVPAGALASARRYQLSVRALTAPGAAAARFETGTTTLFDREP